MKNTHPAINSIIIGLGTAVGMAIIVALAGIHPFNADGTLNINDLLVYLVSTVLTTAGTATITYFKSNPQQIQAAEAEATQIGLNALQQGIANLESRMHLRFDHLTAHITSLQRQQTALSVPPTPLPPPTIRSVLAPSQTQIVPMPSLDFSQSGGAASTVPSVTSVMRAAPPS